MSDKFPGWAPDWLRKLVFEPDCSTGTHPALRKLAKWLLVYMPADKNPGLAFKWLKEAAEKCDRVPDDAELKRLLSWANAKLGAQDGDGNYSRREKVEIDIDYIYELVIGGPHRAEYRELSPVRLHDVKWRCTATVLDAWAEYSGEHDPWVCHGADDDFLTLRLSDMRERASCFAQITPSPMREQYGRTVDRRLSQHTLDNTGPRLCLVTEFDFALVNKKRQPTIWAPLIKACAERGYSVLDMNAALSAYLRTRGPLWMTVYSGGKSFQSWFPCRDIDEQELEDWFYEEARPIGACPSTWCRSQFVRMPDGSRDDGARQGVEYFSPQILEGTKTAPNATSDAVLIYG
jgi:hypothetical protein